MRVTHKVVGDGIWAIVMHGTPNTDCIERDHWTFFASAGDYPWPVAHASVGTGVYCEAIGCKAKGYIDWIDVPEHSRRLGWGTRAVALLDRHYGSTEYTSTETECADAFWNALDARKAVAP